MKPKSDFKPIGIKYLFNNHTSDKISNSGLTVYFEWFSVALWGNKLICGDAYASSDVRPHLHIEDI